MTTENSQFFAILTAVGEAKQANANALGVPWTFSAMGVGDANGTDPIPDRLQTRLVNERRRAPLNEIKIDPNNLNIIIAEQVIPPEAGGWWIREVGLYDAHDDLVAVANCAPSYKPLLNQGTGKTQVIRLNIIVTSTANIQLKIDPAVVLATREYVDRSILNVLPKDKVPGTYTKVQINERGIVVAGWNPTTLADHGITDGATRQYVDDGLSKKFSNTGGFISGPVRISSRQSSGVYGLMVENPDLNGWCSISLSAPNGACTLSYVGGTIDLHIGNHSGGYADVYAGYVVSNGVECQTVLGFLKPTLAFWKPINGIIILPAGGTWAFAMTTNNGAGVPVTSETGILPGGASLGSDGARGFTWRIQ